jgi:membrane-bound ClpP family serine protease
MWSLFGCHALLALQQRVPIVFRPSTCDLDLCSNSAHVGPKLPKCGTRGHMRLHRVIRLFYIPRASKQAIISCMGDTHLIWAIVLIAVAAILFFVEMNIPSGGLLSVLSLFSLAAGVFLLFKVDTNVGLIGAILSMLSIPFAIALAIKIMPHTPMGRLMVLKSKKRKGVELAMGEQGIAGGRGREARKALIGVEGTAVTDLRPIGTCVIQGERQDCMAVQGSVKAGATIRVVSAEGMQVKVQEIKQSEQVS